MPAATINDGRTGDNGPRGAGSAHQKPATGTGTCLPGLCPRGRLGQKKKKALDPSLTKAPGPKTDLQNAKGEDAVDTTGMQSGKRDRGKVYGTNDPVSSSGTKKGIEGRGDETSLQFERDVRDTPANHSVWT